MTCSGLNPKFAAPPAALHAVFASHAHCDAVGRFVWGRKLCKSLGIKVLPYMEVVAGKQGKVHSFTCGPSKVSLLQGRLEDISRKHPEWNVPLEGTNITEFLD